MADCACEFACESGAQSRSFLIRSEDAARA